MTQTLFALVLFLVPLAYSPGPGNLFFAANGARFGVWATLPASLGYHLATWGMTAALGLGLLAVLERAPHVFAVLRLAGGGYVLWIAWRLWRAATIGSGKDARPAGMLDGAMLLLLNPKAYVIIALMFTQFLDPAQGPQLVLVLSITTVFTLNNLLAFSLWTWAGDRLAARFRDPRHARGLNRSMALLLAGVALWLLAG